MKEEDFKSVQLPTSYQGDESHLIGVETTGDLGTNGGHRLVTLNLDDHFVYLYEAVSGTDRYPPGRMMHVNLSRVEFERAITIYTARLGRMEEEAAKRRKEAADKKEAGGDDFDPFLESDDLP